MIKKYAQSRNCKFQPSWQTNRPWLGFDDVNGVMTFSVCQQFSRDNDENAFVKGTKYLRIDGIKAH
ncbi:hypothetical protein DPMN_030814 [Dreissena polymorpha]|uniref:Uncharacterized protein n=1 Tax=Dreissena polymorpha TaxID=45954 RepID=A0A9D4LYU1_DREPO|nr:hypothetical protein DPMN_030814 [Dreissena polymorpha]